MQQYGYVIRKDGTIPFDPELDTVHRQAILAAIREAGYDVYYDPIDNEHKVRKPDADVGRD